MYTKFIVLTTQRSGSTYLIHLLGTHPNVISFSEVMNEAAIGWGRWKSTFRKKNNPLLLPLRNIAPSLFLNRVVFRSYPPSIHAVGFKLMYSQINRFPSVLRFLKEHEVKIIHLKRSNLLEMYVSLKRGEVSDVWHTTDQALTPDVRLYLQPADCREFFTKIGTLQKRFDRFFVGGSMMSMSYEHLRGNKNNEMEKIERFLSIRHHLLTSTFQKMNQLPLHECIINYSELKRALRNTPWKRFFTV